MKHILSLTLMVAALIAFTVTNSSAQFAPENLWTLRITSGAQDLVGPNTTDSKVGPDFGGNLAYGLGSGVSLFGESGYGWTNFQSVDGLRLVQVPILGGLTFAFNSQPVATTFTPYIGAAAGVFKLMQQQDGNNLVVAGVEQNFTDFALQGLAGIGYMLSDNSSIDLRAKYDHVFSDKGNPGLESHALNNVGVTLGISYMLGR